MAKHGLGRGLGALISDEPLSEEEAQRVEELKINEVAPNSKQPRTHFDTEKLQSLADSIARHGVLQPIIVQKAEGGFYRIVAGERRWRAAKMAGLTTIPALVRDGEELKNAEIALIENLQREDLNPIEEALGYKNLMTAFSMTQEQVSESVGKSRSAVANSLRLLALDEEILALVKERALSEGHARALLSLADRELRLFAASKVIEEGLSVRQTEALVKRLTEKKQKPSSEQIQTEYILADISKKLQAALSTKVHITKGKKKGKIEIEYYSNEDLERIVKLIEKR